MCPLYCIIKEDWADLFDKFLIGHFFHELGVVNKKLVGLVEVTE